MLICHKFDVFQEIIISRATSGWRREIELNFGSLPPIPEGLATLSTGHGGRGSLADLQADNRGK